MVASHVNLIRVESETAPDDVQAMLREVRLAVAELVPAVVGVARKVHGAAMLVDARYSDLTRALIAAGMRDQDVGVCEIPGVLDMDQDLEALVELLMAASEPCAFEPALAAAEGREWAR